MPLVTLSLEAGRTREQKGQLADAVYEALRTGVRIPENDRFAAIREDAAGDRIADPEYLGVARGEGAGWSLGDGMAQYVERAQREREQKEQGRQ